MINSGRRTIQLRLPALFVSLFVFAVIGGAVYVWHAQQLPRIATSYEQRSEYLAGQGQWELAELCLKRCLDIEPNRASAIIRLAEVSKETAKTEGKKAATVSLYYRAVSLAPDCIPLRLDLAELELELEHYSRAEYQARRALERAPDDHEALRLVSLASFHQFEIGEPVAEETLIAETQLALKANPGDVQLTNALATFYREYARELDAPLRTEWADRVMDEMVTCRPDRAMAYLARHRYRKKYQLPGALSDLERANALAPEDPLVRFALAEHKLETQEWDEAIHQFTDVVKRTRQAEAYWRLGQCYLGIGEPEIAVSTWEAGLVIESESVQLLLELARFFVSQNEPDKATPFLEELADLVPRHLSIHQRDSNSEFWLATELVRARWHLCENRSQAAIELLRMMTRTCLLHETASTRETLLQTWHLLGDTYRELGQWDQAARSYAQAAELEGGSTATEVLAARALAASGNRVAAIRYCQEALDERPDAKDLWLTCVEIQVDQQRHVVAPDRDLASVHATIDRAKELASSDWRIPLFRADAWLLADSASLRKQTRQHLEASEERHRHDARFWQQLVFRYEQLGDPDGVGRALTHLSSLVPRSSDVSLTKAQLYLQRGDMTSAQNELQPLLERDNKQWRQIALSHMTNLELRRGKNSSAYEYLVKCHAESPANIEAVWQLGKLALKTRNWERVQKWETQLRHLEGGQGCRWRWLKAFSILNQTDADDEARLEQVTVLRFYIEAQRPGWPPVQLLKAAVAERKGRIEDAIGAYTDAVTAGVAEPRVYRRLIELLCQRKQVELARLYLAQAKQLLPPSVERTQVIERSEAVIEEVFRMSTKGNSEDAVSHRTAHRLWISRP